MTPFTSKSHALIVKVFTEVIEISKRLDNDLELENDALRLLENVHRKYSYYDKATQCKTRRVEVLGQLNAAKQLETNTPDINNDDDVKLVFHKK